MVITMLTITTYAATSLSIIPRPENMTLGKGEFIINKSTIIVCDSATAGKAEQLADLLEPATGFELEIQQGGAPSGNFIKFQLASSKKESNPEWYQLSVTPASITVTATANAGLFYGSQTILQLLPPQIYNKSIVKDVVWYVPGVEISDAPQYQWRGMMLDVSRYFFDKEFLFRYLDMMAMHKMNMLHWHLIDDCGWRIEIKKYPKLTTLGAFRGKGVERYGGFYTQEDIKEIVTYAAERNITIVPEIELPAHTLSAIVAYPYLSCTGKQQELPDHHFISRDLYCAGKDTTWVFIKDVLTEVLQMFPGEYIHIGGDEAKYDNWKKCPDCQKKMSELGLKDEHQLQGWMTTEVEDFLAEHNRRIIGWDEILKCGVSTKAGIMTWYRPKTAGIGAKRGNPVVMALTKHCYFDAPESKLPGEVKGASWIPPVSLQNAYCWNPRPNGLSDKEAENIIGANGCIWTDQLLHNNFLRDLNTLNDHRSEAYVEYFSLPRMAALAEVLWTPQAKQNWAGFSRRMALEYNRYASAGYNYRLPLPIIQHTSEADGTLIKAVAPVRGGTVHYTTDGTYPNIYSPKYTAPFKVSDFSKFKAISVAPDKTHHSLTFESNAKAGKRKGKHGRQIGTWKDSMIGSGTAKTAVYDLTGFINRKGTYLITFVYKSGEQRLDIDSVKLLQNGKVIAEDVHHGFSGGTTSRNVYKLNVKEYETGAAYKMEAAVYGDTGNNSTGIIFGSFRKRSR